MKPRVTQAVILAGGLGERLRPLTQIIPKPLLPIGERSVLEIIISRMAQAGIQDIFLAVNYRFEMFQAYLGDGQRYGVRLIYSREDVPLGTAGPLKLVAEQLGPGLLVTNGDILTTADYRAICEQFERSDADLVLATKEFHTPLSYGVVTVEQGRVTALEEKPTVAARINAGIYALRTALLAYVPAGRAYSMNTFIQAVLAQGHVVAQYDLRELWFDIGQMAEYERVQNMVGSGALIV